jgi:hypothetical protein
VSKASVSAELMVPNQQEVTDGLHDTVQFAALYIHCMNLSKCWDEFADLVGG